MRRWLAEVSGRRSDLRVLRDWPVPGVDFVEQGGEIYLASRDFQEFTEPEQVIDCAREKLKILVAAVSVLEPTLEPPTTSKIIREGSPGGTIFASASLGITGRATAKATLRDASGNELPVGPSCAQLLLEAANASRYFGQAMEKLQEADTFKDIYPVVEDLNAFLRKTGLGSSVCNAELCTKAELERFTRTAHTERGIGGRHGGEVKQEPHKNPMSVAEAKGFLRRLLQDASLKLYSIGEGSSR